MNRRSTPTLFRLLAVLLGATLLLAACGSDSEGSSGSDGAETSDTTAEGDAADDGAFPVTIEHQFGETVIEEAPERIVTAGLMEQDVVLALGEVPVAATEWFGEQPGALWPWAQEKLEELDGEEPEVLTQTDGIDVEAIAAQQPDLIIALYGEVDEDTYGKLSQIAPTLVPEEGVGFFAISWQDMTTTVGKALGKADEAEALVEETEALFDQAREDHPEFEGKQAIVATPYEGIFVYGPDDPRGRFLTNLGFELPEGLVEATGESFGGNLSEEKASMLDGDLIIWLDPDDAEGDLGGPLYETFAVHTEGREVGLSSFDDPLGAATSFVTPLSIPFLLDGILPKMAAAIDGDPATEVPA